MYLKLTRVQKKEKPIKTFKNIENFKKSVKLIEPNSEVQKQTFQKINMLEIQHLYLSDLNQESIKFMKNTDDKNVSNEIKTTLFIGKTWTQEENNLLYNYVIVQKIFDWEKLSQLLKINVKQVKWQWQRMIYPKIKCFDKIAGSYKWSDAEDSFLISFQKKKPEKWQQISTFLPDRSSYSIEARWKRIFAKNTASKQQTEPIAQLDSSSSQESLQGAYDYRRRIILKMNQAYRKKLNQSKEKVLK